MRIYAKTHANPDTSSGQRRRSVRCYARTTRRAPLRKRCGALASWRPTRVVWCSSRASVRRRRRGPDDVWRNCSSNGRRRLTYHRARSACTCRKLTELSAGARASPGCVGASRRPGDRRPRRVGADAVGGRAATSSGARRTTGVGRTATSLTTCRDGRRCDEKSYRGSMKRVELAGVATLGAYL